MTTASAFVYAMSILSVACALEGYRRAGMFLSGLAIVIAVVQLIVLLVKS